MKRLTLPLAILALLAAGGVLTGCGGTSDAPAADVSVQFAWVHTIEYSGFFLAEENGYYDDANLNVELRTGGFGADGTFIDHMGQMKAGNATFGLAPADQLLVAREEGYPFVAIAAIYQRSPIAWISLAENNIQTPQDWIGRTVQVDEATGATGIAYNALLASQGITHDQITEVPREDFTNAALIEGRADVISAFINNQPVQLEQQGIAYSAILASDYGIEIYANVLFTTEDMIANQPDVVERFLRATLHGYEDAVADPAHAAEVTVALGNGLDLASETISMERAVPLLNPGGRPLGTMLAEDWQSTYEILVEQGILTGSSSVDNAFTLDFLNKIYGN